MTDTSLTLLPPNASTLARRVAASGFSTPTGIVPKLWNADTCPAELLYILAWAESVDDWDASWSDARKRAVIKASRAIHRIKGTPAAIKNALTARGQSDAIVLERYDSWVRDGSNSYDGTREHGGSLSWAVYKIILKQPITIDQAEAIEVSIKQVTRNCCHLVGFDFSQAALRHNGTANRDGSYTRGVINSTKVST